MRVRCKFCKSNINRDEALRRNLSYFCSDSCFRQHSLEKLKSKPRKVDGPTRETRDLVLKLDHHKCRICFRKSTLHIHHVVYRSQGGPHIPSNLITLCQVCHDLVHSNKKYYQPMCLELIAMRENNGS